jgi:hypothetical protein
MKKKIGDLTIREIVEICNFGDCEHCPVVYICNTIVNSASDSEFEDTLDNEIEV